MAMSMPKEVDYTMMSTFLRCRKRYWWRMVRNLVGLQPPTAAEFGRCIHKALDVWHLEHAKDKVLAMFKSEFKEDPTDEKRTIEVGVKLLSLYMEKYEQEGFVVRECELEFSLDIPGTERTLIGRVDKVIEWDGAIYVMDHKTTSRLGYEFFNKIKPNMQFDGYIWAVRQMGYPTCSGVVMDALLVAKGLTVPSQLARLTPLARDISTRTEEDLKRYITNIQAIIDDMEYCYDQDEWYENTESCCDFIECPYRKLCKEDDNIRERIVSSDFKTEVWSPRAEVKSQ